MDAQGNVIVTGYSIGGGYNSDYATIKYSNSGVPLWTNRYNGSANGADFATALAADASDNVIVTGSSGVNFMSYDVDYVTIKYSSAGEPLWTNRYDAPVHGDDEASALAVDGGNNVIVTGSSSATAFPFFHYNYLTVKYSSDGTPLWINRYGLGGGGDGANAVATDGNNDVIVTGAAANLSGYSDCVTVKYSSNGAPLWTNRYNGPANWADAGIAVAVDASNDVIVTGLSYASASYNNADYLTLKYSSAGVPLWANFYNGSGNSNDLVRALALDRNGNVIVTGESNNGTNRDYATVKYSSAGAPLWTNRYNGPANSDDIAYAVAVDADSSVIVTGFSADAGGHADYLTIAYSSAGVPLWTNRHDSPTNGNDMAFAVAVDGPGNMFVTGYSTSEVVPDYLTIKYAIMKPIPLSLQRAGNHLVLSWTNAAFRLQCAPAVTGPFTNVTKATSPYTHLITGAQQFFRLIAN